MNPRPILFRAFHTPTSTLFDVYCLTNDYVFEDTMDGIETSDTNPAHRNDCILMQFSGLKTEDGTGIYEGDILKTVWQEPLNMNPAGQSVIYNEVVFRDGCFGYIGENTGEFQPFWMDGIKDGVYPRCTVAGNVHQHRELLASDSEESKPWDRTKFSHIENLLPEVAGKLTNWLAWQSAFITCCKADDWLTDAIYKLDWKTIKEEYFFGEQVGVIDAYKENFYK